MSETMERRPEIGFSSYDRLFPSRDLMPEGGFGNLIALPLQRSAREHGHSVFIDDGLNPFPDQWAYLASIQKIDAAALGSLLRILTSRQYGATGIRLPIVLMDLFLYLAQSRQHQPGGGGERKSVNALLAPALSRITSWATAQAAATEAKNALAASDSVSLRLVHQVVSEAMSVSDQPLSVALATKLAPLTNKRPAHENYVLIDK